MRDEQPSHPISGGMGSLTAEAYLIQGLQTRKADYERV